MSPKQKNEFEREFRKYKKELRKLVDEYNYPYIKTLFSTNLWLIKDYPRRKQIYDERGYKQP